MGKKGVKQFFSKDDIENYRKALKDYNPLRILKKRREDNETNKKSE